MEPQAFCGNEENCLNCCIHRECLKECQVNEVAVTEENPSVCQWPEQHINNKVLQPLEEQKEILELKEVIVQQLEQLERQEQLEQLEQQQQLNDFENEESHSHFHSHGSHHRHDLECGHEIVLHGDHVDFIVDSHLHHVHGDHCDDHGFVDIQHFWNSIEFCDCPPIENKKDEDISSKLDLVNRTELIQFEESDKFLNLQNDISGPEINNLPCGTCKRKKKSMKPSLQIKTEEKNSEIPEPILKYVKAKYQLGVTVDSPLIILKGLTIEMEEKIQNILKKDFQLTCNTLLSFATLTEDHIKALREKDTQMRNINSLYSNAQSLIENISSEISFVKKTKNAACCQRFREKKKQKMESLQQTIQVLGVKCQELNSKVRQLELEKAKLQQIYLSSTPISSQYQQFQYQQQQFLIP